MSNPVSSTSSSQPAQPPATQAAVTRCGISDFPSTLQSGCGISKVTSVFAWIGDKFTSAWKLFTGSLSTFYQKYILWQPTTLSERLAAGTTGTGVLLDVIKEELDPQRTKMVVEASYNLKTMSTNLSGSDPDLLKNFLFVTHKALEEPANLGLPGGSLKIQAFAVQNNQDGTFTWRCPQNNINFSTSKNIFDVVNRGDNVTAEQLEQRFKDLISQNFYVVGNAMQYLTQ